MKLRISRKFGNNVWNFDEMLKYIKAELLAVERCFAFQNDVSEENPFTTSMFFNSSEQKNSIHKDVSFNSFGNNNSFTSFNKKRQCVYCEKDHSPSQCDNVTSVKTRVSILRKKARCFVCLRPGHLATHCASKYKCNKCDKKHHISICNGSKVNGENQHQGGAEKATHVGTTSTRTAENSQNILLQTAVGMVSHTNGGGSTLPARLLFDGGSQRTYVRDEITKKLSLPKVRTERVIIKTFGEEKAAAKELDVVRLKVESKFGLEDVYVEALSVPFICSPLKDQNIKAAVSHYDHLKGLPLADVVNDNTNLQVDILIGMDYYFSFIMCESIRGKSGPVALKSTLGWVLAGRNVSKNNGPCHLLQNTAEIVNTLRVDCSSNEDPLRKQLEFFWKVESVDDHQIDFVNRFKEEIHFDGERYVNKLPFKEEHEIIPDNYEVSYKRAVSLRKRLEAKPELLESYDAIFDDYLQQGIVEVINESDPPDPGFVHYLPHRPVVRCDKETTKVRAVFDASARAAGLASLNDCLYTGPNLLAKIYDVLFRFRFHPVGIISDIKQAFLNVGIDESHRDFLRFVWYNEKGEMTNYRFTRAVFGVNSSPFLLNGTILHHLQGYKDSDPELVAKIQSSLYVDDCTSGADDLEEGKKFYTRAKAIMLEGGFFKAIWPFPNIIL